jgi:outer membrane murein-binding lipoprotein Lpp
MKKILALASVVFLGGCASLTPERIELALSTCPVLKTYTPEQMKQAASELKALPTESQIAVLVTDYSKLRQACRAAEKKLKEVTGK